MSQANVATDPDEVTREQLRTTSGHERSQLDVAGDDHDLSGMDTKRQAPIESVAKNVVRRYDERRAAIREMVANAHTACIQRAKALIRDAGRTDEVDMANVVDVLDFAEQAFGYEPIITVKHNKDPSARYTLKIADNGIGIDAQTAYALRDIGLSGWHMDGTTNGKFGQGTMSGFLLSGVYGVFHMLTNSMFTDDNYRAEWKLTDLNRLDGERDEIGTTFIWPTFCEEAQDIDVADAVESYAEGMLVPIIYEEYDEDGNQTGASDDFLPTHMEEYYPDDSLVVTYEDAFGKAVWSPDKPDSGYKTFCGYQPITRNDSLYGMNTYKMPSKFDFRLKVEDGSIIEVDGDMDHYLVGKTPVNQQKYRSMLLSNRNVVPESHVDSEDAGYMDDDGQLYTTDERLADQKSDLTYVPDDQTDDIERAVIGGKHEGRPIVSDDEWDEMDDGRIGEQFVPRSEIPDDVEVLEAMKPTDDRDRFEQKHVQNVLQRYTEKLWEQLKDRTGEVFQQVDTFDDVFELEGNEKALFHDGISRFGPNFKRSDPETIKESIEDELGATLDTDVCEKMGLMNKTVSLAPRGRRSVSRKENRTKKPVWKVIRKATDGDKNGDVYMGHLISNRKANLVWEMGENNQVIQAGSELRGELIEKLGWKHLNDLPSRNFEDEVDADLSDDFLDSWEKDTGTSSSGGNSMDDDVKQLSYDDKRAMKRSVDVRKGAGNSNQISSVNGEQLFKTLNQDDYNGASFRHKTIEKLVLFRQTEHSLDAGTEYVNTGTHVYYAVVPNYVYDYLIEAERAFTPDEFEIHVRQQTYELDWSATGRDERTIGSADERDVIVLSKPSDFERFDEYDAMDDMRDAIESTLRSKGRLDDDQSIRSVAVMRGLSEYYAYLHRDGCYDLGPTESAPSIISLRYNGAGYPVHARFDRRSLFYDSVLDELDRGAVEWDMLDIDWQDDEMIEALTRLQDEGGFVSTDDDSELDVPNDHRLRLDERAFGDADISRDEMWLHKTLQRLEEAGGFPDGDSQ